MPNESMHNTVKRYTTTITKRGQVTLPADIRRLLKAKCKDKVTFTVDDGRVCLSQETFTLESAYGSVMPLRRPEDFEDVSRAAKDEKAERTARRPRKTK